jgi:hypothetical protein
MKKHCIIILIYIFLPQTCLSQTDNLLSTFLSTLNSIKSIYKCDILDLSYKETDCNSPTYINSNFCNLNKIRQHTSDDFIFILDCLPQKTLFFTKKLQKIKNHIHTLINDPHSEVCLLSQQLFYAEKTSLEIKNSNKKHCFSLTITYDN